MTAPPTGVVSPEKAADITARVATRASQVVHQRDTWINDQLCEAIMGGMRNGNEPGEMGDALPVVNTGTGKTISSITAGSNHTCARFDDGRLKCWGRNNAGQLGAGEAAGPAGEWDFEQLDGEI